MARYRKVSTQIWNDEKFRTFSRDGKLVFLFLMTHPGMTAIGAMRGNLPGLAAELGIPDKAFRAAFQEPQTHGMAQYDESASFIALPNFLKHNVPENPNVVKAWGSSLELLPECDLKRELIVRTKAFTEGLPEPFQKALPKAFTEGLPEPFLKGMPIQEQEQEQYGKGELDFPFLLDFQNSATLSSPHTAQTDEKSGVDYVEGYRKAVQELVGALPGVKIPRVNSAELQQLHELQVGFKTIENACWLAIARRHGSKSDTEPVKSFRYFLPVIEEVRLNPLPPGYSDYVKSKALRASVVSVGKEI